MCMLRSLRDFSCIGLVVVLSFSFVRNAGAATTFVDSDGDGLSDVWETRVYASDPLKADTDGDGYMDKLEVANGYSPTSTATSVYGDYDQDGLSDRLELAFGTDPTLPDTNADGRLDGPEIEEGFSPTSTVLTPMKKTLVVNLKKQTMERRLDGIVFDSYIVSTGKPGMATPVGTFKVLQKHPRAWSSSAKLWMPYWMHFSGRGHGFHELPEWPGGKKEGENHLGKPVSHGCIRLGIGAAKKIYDWSPVGTPVIITKM